MLTVNEKYNMLSNFLDEALPPHLAKYSGTSIKNAFETLKSKMFSNWLKGAGRKIGPRQAEIAKSRIDQALRQPAYMKSMAKKYNVPIPQAAAPVAAPGRKFISKPSSPAYA